MITRAINWQTRYGSSSHGFRYIARTSSPTRTSCRRRDRRYVDIATVDAIRERPDIEATLFEFLRDLITLTVTGDLEKEFVARLQQLTGPAMAKGVEDTVFYNYNRFIALNEVGGDPSRFGISLHHFHEKAREMQQRWPLTMLATATHDSKRGEDMRARLALLSEQPSAWIDAVRRWSAMAQTHRTNDWPDRNTEYFFVPDARWRVAGMRRTPHGLHGEGVPRGQDLYVVDGPGHDLRGCRTHVRRAVPRPIVT